MAHTSALSFITFVAFVYVFDLGFAYLQELLLKEKKFPLSHFSTFLQFALYSIFARIHASVDDRLQKPQRNKEDDEKKTNNSIYKSPYIGYIATALCVMIARTLSNLSYKYLDFTTKVLFTSSKPIPVMIIGVLFHHKRFTAGEYIATLFLSVGLTLFSYEDAHTSKDFNILGIIMMIMSVTSDSMKSNIQEATMKSQNISGPRMAMWCNLFGGLLTIPGLVYSGELWLGLQFIQENTTMFLQMVAMYLVGYTSSVGVLIFTKRYDAFIASIVTTTRKAITIALSFFLFSKPFYLSHLLAIVLFFIGIGGNLYIKRVGRSKSQKID